MRLKKWLSKFFRVRRVQLFEDPSEEEETDQDEELNELWLEYLRFEVYAARTAVHLSKNPERTRYIE